MKGYLATHFFNEAGYDWSKKVAEIIRGEGIDLYVPQENGEINDKKSNDSIITAEKIAEADNAHLRKANILFASLDGVEIDSGVSAEIGYFSGLIQAEDMHTVRPPYRAIVGIYTDMRQDGTGDNHYYINLYTKGLVLSHGRVVRSTEELKAVIKQIKKGYEMYE